MRHCTPDELMDLAEGARPEASMPHLEACAACRQQLLEVRQVLVEVRDVPVPEPSSLQWAALSAHVSEAVASEVQRSRAPGKERRERGGSWESWAGWAWGLPVAAAAVLTFALVVPGVIGVNGPAPALPPAAEDSAAAAGGTSSAAAVIAEEPATHAPVDPSLGLMFELADVVDLDSDPAPVLAMGSGTLDEAVGDLSPDEQHELARLLKEAMDGPGA